MVQLNFTPEIEVFYMLLDRYLSIFSFTSLKHHIQGGWGGWPTGNGKNVNSSQAQLGQATCLAVA